MTPDTLLPLCKTLWTDASQSLGQEASRWQTNRVVQPHGTRRTLLLWRVWDKRCRAHGLDHRFFCWCLNYDPEKFYNHETHWQLHLYINTIRLYRHADTLRNLLPDMLTKSQKFPFEYVADDHSVQLVWNFELPTAQDSLVGKVSPVLVTALQSTAHVHDEVFQILDLPAVKRVPSTRPKARPTASQSHSNPGGSLSRDISASLRKTVIARDSHCHICGDIFQNTDEIHIDHVIPWAKGGYTVLENLKASHAQCNLRKGAGN